MRTIILLILVPLTAATMYHDVSTQNGLLIIKTDKVRIRTGFERVLHKVNLEDLKQNINFIEHISTNLNMSDHISQTLNFKLNKANEKLLALYPRRTKRGLINALGTAIKFISGNPDQTDLDMIHQNLETLEVNSNKIINNQARQIRINNLLQDTINKVAKSLRSIKQEVNSKHLDFKNDLELINLIFNIDIIIRTLEDIEEQIAFSKNNFLNKNILSPNEKEYIWKSLKEQQLNIKFEDEIYKFIEAIVSLQNNHIIIIVKIPTIEQQEYTLMQIEPVNANGNRIDTAIRYIAAHQQTFYEQKERCYICVNDNPVNDECVFNILVNQKARCRMHKQSDQPIVKELNAETILINTDTAVHILDSCGDSRIVSSPTIVEAGKPTTWQLRPTRVISPNRYSVPDSPGTPIRVVSPTTTSIFLNLIQLSLMPLWGGTIQQISILRLQLEQTASSGKIERSDYSRGAIPKAVPEVRIDVMAKRQNQPIPIKKRNETTLDADPGHPQDPQPHIRCAPKPAEPHTPRKNPNIPSHSTSVPQCPSSSRRIETEMMHENRSQIPPPQSSQLDIR
ncbi:uncharacterized protein LOC134203917 [Armigeres subalbatus]|uniref:uncharacterized protein LOC134203917 n=1 Tax=Armigeres subalbatus TaxID=124917 RepID=UPI002ED2930A